MKGKISAGIFRVMAVVSALAIGGGYVAWRQVEAKKAMAEQAEAKEKGQREKLLREMDEAWQEELELELMPGSKNPGRSITRGEIEEILEKRGDFIQPIPGIPEGSEDFSNVIPLLSGSKSISMPLFTKEQIEELQDKGAIVPVQGQYLFPSSKIGILRLPKKEAEPPVKEEPEKSE